MISQCLPVYFNDFTVNTSFWICIFHFAVTHRSNFLFVKQGLSYESDRCKYTLKKPHIKINFTMAYCKLS